MAAETIRRDVVAVRHSQDHWEGNPADLIKLIKAAQVLADKPHRAKWPLTPLLLSKMRKVIKSWSTPGCPRREI